MKGSHKRHSFYLYCIFLTLQIGSSFLGGCSLAPKRDSDGPPRSPPPLRAQEVIPKKEPLVKGANRDYVRRGRHYKIMKTNHRYKATGVASWYGKKFHGAFTSSGEPYNMYAMTAAHPTLPIPSYVRVTNLTNGKSVVVRVNDRGPFLKGRLIDLSYNAARKLGFEQKGVTRVHIAALPPFQFIQTIPSTSKPLMLAQNKK